MAVEIERKFLVKNDDFKLEAKRIHKIRQGYLNSNKNRAVRVRVWDEIGYLTIKGKSNASGTSRFEWEKEIPIAEAELLLLLCEPSVLEKNRYIIEHGNHTFEVDVFLGINDGLIVAEIELQDEDEPFSKPNWLGKEVTGDPKFYNASLSKTPYSEWL